jgi:hypothetical protein
MQFEELKKILDELVTKYQSLKDLSPSEQNKEMAKYLSSRPEFEECGAAPDGVWVWFKNGGLIIFENSNPNNPPTDVIASSKDSQKAAIKMIALLQSEMSGIISGGPSSDTEARKKFEKIAFIQSSLARIRSSGRGTQDDIKNLTAAYQDLISSSSISDDVKQQKVAEFSTLLQSIVSNPSGTPTGQASTIISGSSTHYGLPMSNTACLYTAFDEKDAIQFGDIQAYLEKDNWYKTKVVFNASVEDLITLPECSVFYLDSHSSNMARRHSDDWFPLGNVYAIYTSTEVNKPNWDKYEKLFDAGEIAVYHPIITYIPIPLISRLDLERPHFAITDRFAKKYWSFTKNSFVYLDSCHSLESTSADFRNVLFEKNVSVIAGWIGTGIMNLGMETAAYLFDRLLGANDFKGEGPVIVPKEEDTGSHLKQRPFDWLALKDDMIRKGLGICKDGSRLDFDCGGKGDFGLLRPSIEYLEVDEDEGKLTLHGLFGKRQNKGEKVTIDGQDLHIAEWDDAGNKIVCDNLPQGGQGSIGPVAVTINNVKSNEVPLTGWHGSFTYTVDNNGGDPKAKIEFTAFLRGDVHKSRKKPGEDFSRPGPAAAVIRLVKDMNNPAHYESGGSYNDGDGTYELSGSGDITPGNSPEGGLGLWGWFKYLNDPHLNLYLILITGQNAKLKIRDNRTGTVTYNGPSNINAGYILMRAIL